MASQGGYPRGVHGRPWAAQTPAPRGKQPYRAGGSLIGRAPSNGVTSGAVKPSPNPSLITHPRGQYGKGRVKGKQPR